MQENNINQENLVQVKTFEIFKGKKDKTGKIIKKRAVGVSRLFGNTRTYHVFIKAISQARYFILPERENYDQYQYVILTREESKVPEHKFFWSSVGDGSVLLGKNTGLVSLNWDFFNSEDIYMNLNPIKDEAINMNKTRRAV